MQHIRYLLWNYAYDFQWSKRENLRFILFRFRYINRSGIYFRETIIMSWSLKCVLWSLVKSSYHAFCFSSFISGFNSEKSNIREVHLSRWLYNYPVILIRLIRILLQGYTIHVLRRPRITNRRLIRGNCVVSFSDVVKMMI